jgi:hypothetical protein
MDGRAKLKRPKGLGCCLSVTVVSEGSSRVDRQKSLDASYPSSQRLAANPVAISGLIDADHARCPRVVDVIKEQQLDPGRML